MNAKQREEIVAYMELQGWCLVWHKNYKMLRVLRRPDGHEIIWDKNAGWFTARNSEEVSRDFVSTDNYLCSGYINTPWIHPCVNDLTWELIHALAEAA